VSYQVLLDQRVREDLDCAVSRYNCISIDLAAKFEDAVFEYLNLLTYNPHFARVFNEVRRLPLKKFPQVIYFTVDDIARRVTVIAILHGAADPKIYRSL
jgi:plasmid stabilization system protein ParE